MTPEERAATCKTPEEARNLIKNARALANEEVALAAERRLFELEGLAHDDPKDPHVRAVWEGISAYENIVLGRKHGRNVPDTAPTTRSSYGLAASTRRTDLTVLSRPAIRR